MAGLMVGSTRFDADLVIFDKDGTLLDFDVMWGNLLIGTVGALAAQVAEHQALVTDMYLALGYDPQRRWTDPHGPWAMATTEQGLTILAAVLYHHGQPWHLAEAAVRDAWREMSAPAMLPRLTQPTTDLTSLFLALRRAGIRVALDTTDDRSATEATLNFLNISHLVDSVVCGDDDLPGKPAPERLLATCQRLSVPAERTVMVGDTVFDLLMGQRAGAGLVVGVLTGATDWATLAAHADVVLNSIAELRASDP